MRRPKWSIPVVALLAGVFLVPAIAFAAPETTEICHFNADDDPGVPDWELLEVNSNSVDSHVAHGDGFPGEPVPGTGGEYVFTDECVPELAEPVVFAVAYTDTDSTDGGYNQIDDLLIAALVDGPDAARDGLLGVGDIVEMYTYPRDYDLALGRGDFGIDQHTVSQVFGANEFGCAVAIEGVGGGVNFIRNPATFEAYGEVGGTVFLDAFDSGAQTLIVTENSISMPGENIGPLTVFGANEDDRFIDVELNCAP